jgi:subtilisin-like proprotein convertase family protein
MPRFVTILLVGLLALAAAALSRPAPVRALPTTFSNTTPITIPNEGAADPYPSRIDVSGLTGVITDLDVTISGLSHRFTEEVDILLVGPDGRTVMLLSNFAFASSVANVTVTFDDQAPPAPNPLVSGRFRPPHTNSVGRFPAPAPAPPQGVLLSTFNGTDPNGTWSLFVADHLHIEAFGPSNGEIAGGWSLTLTVGPPVPPIAVTTVSNPDAIRIPAIGSEEGPANPYPSTITVSGLAGSILDVDVTITGYGHAYPRTVDMLLVGPGGQHVMLMSDAGGDNAASDVNLIFDDAARGTMRASTVASGTYQPTNLVGFLTGDALAAPAPAEPYGTTLSAFNGTNPNGIWSLFVHDDSIVNSGEIAGGWSLTIDVGPVAPHGPVTATASNPQRLNISARDREGPASLYPSTIVVADVFGLIIDVDVSIVGFSHAFPDDVDILLVGPDGQHVMLMSDVGGDNAASDVNLTFDDEAPGELTTLVASGTYRPSNDTAPGEPLDPLGAPAPAPPHGTTLSVNDRLNPNGTWRLYVWDDSAEDGGAITGGWSLSITTTTDFIAPEITVPGDLTIEATVLSGAVVSYAASAADDVDGVVPVSCGPPSGAPFPMETTTVSCSATDSSGNAASASFTVTVVDTTPPVLTVPAGGWVEATGPDGAVVTYSASATDVADGVLIPTCAPLSGSTFALGETTVACSATDASGNIATASFTVSVQDTTAPLVTVPDDLWVEATGPDGAVASYAASATDAVDGTLTPSCAPPSGAVFPLGTTTVTCTATDTAGNTGSEFLIVIVVDTTPPALTVPATISVLATSPAGAVVTFTASASDTVDGTLAPTCDPPSGSTFRIGTTTVTCTATDNAGNTGGRPPSRSW